MRARERPVTRTKGLVQAHGRSLRLMTRWESTKSKEIQVSAHQEQRPAPVRSVALIILGSVLGLMALVLLGGGATTLWADQTKRDSAGYFTGSTHRIANGSYAVTHDGVDVHNLPEWADGGELARVRVAATSDTGRPLFVGIARERDVDAYLANVAHANLNDYGVAESKQEYDPVSGTATPLRPVSQDIWAASATGSGPTAITWKLREGDWSVVLMNADASKGVAADVKVGVDVGYLGWLSAGLLVFGGVLAAGAVLLIVRGGGRRDKRPVPLASPLPTAA